MEKLKSFIQLAEWEGIAFDDLLNLLCYGLLGVFMDGRSLSQNLQRHYYSIATFPIRTFF